MQILVPPGVIVDTTVPSKTSGKRKFYPGEYEHLKSLIDSVNKTNKSCADIKEYFGYKGFGYNLDINDHSCFVQQDGTKQVRSYLFMYACKATTTYAAVALLEVAHVDITIADEHGDSPLKSLFKKSRISHKLCTAILKKLATMKISVSSSELAAIEARLSRVNGLKQNHEANIIYEEVLRHNKKQKAVEVSSCSPPGTPINTTTTSSSSSTSVSTAATISKRLRLSATDKEDADVAVLTLSDCVRDDIDLLQASIDQLKKHITHLATAVNCSKEIQEAYSTDRDVISLLRTEQNTLAPSLIDDLTRHVKLRREMFTLFTAVRNRYNDAEQHIPTNTLSQGNTSNNFRLNR